MSSQFVTIHWSIGYSSQNAALLVHADYDTWHLWASNDRRADCTWYVVGRKASLHMPLPLATTSAAASSSAIVCSSSLSHKMRVNLVVACVDDEKGDSVARSYCGGALTLNGQRLISAVHVELLARAHESVQL